MIFGLSCFLMLSKFLCVKLQYIKKCKKVTIQKTCLQKTWICFETRVFLGAFLPASKLHCEKMTNVSFWFFIFTLVKEPSDTLDCWCRFLPSVPARWRHLLTKSKQSFWRSSFLPPQLRNRISRHMCTYSLKKPTSVDTKCLKPGRIWICEKAQTHRKLF